jgi:hypothetical protein
MKKCLHRLNHELFVQCQFTGETWSFVRLRDDHIGRPDFQPLQKLQRPADHRTNATTSAGRRIMTDLIDDG